jgi:glycosyltransferase involved in cell wall biosynthesis
VTDAVPVAFVSSHAKAGGAERYLLTLLEALGPAWAREVVCLEQGPLVDRLRERRVPVAVVPTPAGPLGIAASAVRLRRLLSRGRPAVVHANGIKAALVSALALPGAGLPLVWVKHDFSFDGPVARAVAARCREVVAVSRAVAETFGPRQRRKIRVVPVGLAAANVDREDGRRRLLAALGGGPARAVVTLVGRLEPGKGQAELVAAAPALVDRVDGVRIALVGGENPRRREYAAALRADVERLGLRDAVAFLGHRDDTPALIAGSDVVTIPSVPGRHGMGRESFSYVAADAMAAGTPVVAYADGALPEVLCLATAEPSSRSAIGRRWPRRSRGCSPTTLGGDDWQTAG